MPHLRGSIRKRLIVLVLLSSLPALGVILWSGLESRQEAIRQARQDALRLAEDLAEVQNRLTAATRLLLSTLAEMPAVQKLDGPGCAALFRRLIDQNPDYLNILLASPRGEVLASGVPIGAMDIGDRRHVRDALATREFSPGEYILDRFAGEPIFPFALPVFDASGKVKAMLAAALKLGRFSQIYEHADLPGNSFCAITDHRGIRIFMHPAKPDISPIGKLIPREFIEFGAGSESGVMTATGSDGVRRIYAHRQVRLRPDAPPHMYVRVGVPEREAMAAADHVTLRNLALLAGVLASTLAIAWTMGTLTMVRLADRLVAAVGRFGAGDLGARSGLGPGHGEFSRIAAAFDQMADAVVVDRARRERAEEHLRESGERLGRSEQQLGAILDSLRDVHVKYFDSRMRIVWANASLCRLVSAELHDLVGQPCHRALAGRETACPGCPVPGSLDTGEPFETERATDSGRTVISRGTPLRGEDGGVVGLVHVSIDITDRKRAEEHVLAAKEAAEAANLAKSTFLATMSHEIRTPMNGVMGMLQLLRITSLDDEQREFVDTALLSSRNLLRILSDILDLSQVEAGVMTIQDEWFELEELTRPVIGALKIEADTKGLDLSVEILPGLPASLKGDQGRIRQVLFNLVGNAVKYTERGQVRLEIYPLPHGGPERAWLHLVVADTGIGIPDDHVRRVFEPFNQVDGSSTRKYGGTGLGLSIVKRLVALMGGNLAVSSEPGQGTEIHVSLPLKPGAGAARDKAAVHPRPGPAPRAKVLVVEDEAINRLAIASILRKLGYAVSQALNGQAALDILAREAHDVVLMDIQMPVMNGIETTRRIRAGEAGPVRSDIPIVALTAYAMVGDREDLMAAGMDDYLAKPVDIEDVERVMDRLLGGAADATPVLCPAFPPALDKTVPAGP